MSRSSVRSAIGKVEPGNFGVKPTLGAARNSFARTAGRLITSFRRASRTTPLPPREGGGEVPEIIDIFPPLILGAIAAAVLTASLRALALVGAALAVTYWLVVTLVVGFEELDGGALAAFVLVVPFYWVLWTLGALGGRLARRVLRRA